MYVLSSGACDLPNSATPMSAADIAAQDAYIALVGSKFSGGTQTLNDLITQLGGSLPGDASGNAGIPTVGTGPLVTNPTGPSAGSPMGRGGVPWVRFAYPGAYGRRKCPAPRVVPLVSGLYPGSPPAAPPPVPVRPVAAPPPPVAAPPAPRPAPSQATCRGPNVCLDLMNGCVRSDQVDTSQLLACAQAGYVGNRNLYPAILAEPDLPFLGSPMPNPPPYHPGMGDAGPLTGGPGSGVFWGSLGLLGFTVWALSGNRQPKRR